MVRGTDKGEQREGNRYQAWERRTGRPAGVKRNELEGPVNRFTAAPLQRPQATASRWGEGGSLNQTNNKKRN